MMCYIGEGRTVVGEKIYIVHFEREILEVRNRISNV